MNKCQHKFDCICCLHDQLKYKYYWAYEKAEDKYPLKIPDEMLNIPEVEGGLWELPFFSPPVNLGGHYNTEPLQISKYQPVEV